MKTLTFDWNCVVSAEKRDVQSRYVQRLVDLHLAKQVDVAITTISASESLPGSKTLCQSAEQFNDRLEKLGWSELTILFGPLIWDLTYWDMARFVDSDAYEKLIDDIWAIIGGIQVRQLPASVTTDLLHSSEMKKWRNVWCDVHTLWTHLDADRDVFITTNTRDFQNKFSELQSLGLRSIKTPEEMVVELSRNS
ncbi:hypothetical protein TG4357_01936 [Thalassovita gelatinovora]|uniref:PIN domain-containing protein n=1 Tax=Thalassovita gelatinovora TaxID=53501 RepID=A0A0N7LV81_THAGE|nr:hypothetical protein [Thalassovita gelatinovora]QIZ80113.1 hypothetical protein HFZ77_06305 [Thalassovita gelatinovora]CUH65562.1 hypothetical protein TG4357_01936 [Thalassovita gelatinovora]SER07621.1 hypothetical protein SAMN04488043_11514 [Thalassovita gelatinovora]